MSESADSDETIQINDGPTSAAEVKWGALWAEFDFGEPDAAGNQYATDTQLHAAVECSEQGIRGDPETLINDAVDAGTLRELKLPATTRGYVWRGESE